MSHTVEYGVSNEVDIQYTIVLNMLQCKLQQSSIYVKGKVSVSSVSAFMREGFAEYRSSREVDVYCVSRKL